MYGTPPSSKKSNSVTTFGWSSAAAKPRLADEALRERGVVAVEVEPLERYLAVERRLAREVHDGHPATGEHPDDLVRADAVTIHRLRATLSDSRTTRGAGISCTAQPLPSGIAEEDERPQGNDWTSLTSTPRPASSARAASMSETTSWRPSGGPGRCLRIPLPIAIDVGDPGA